MQVQTRATKFRPDTDTEATLVAVQTTLSDWLNLVRSEYLEIPGLNLTKHQAKRLWNLDGQTCDVLLQALLDAGFLRCTASGTYVRADLGGT